MENSDFLIQLVTIRRLNQAAFANKDQTTANCALTKALRLQVESGLDLLSNRYLLTVMGINTVAPLFNEN